ncbi:hypothetical protein [Parasitella parasitica]|uniref:Uncharacterized protein n=1 Tax=Parasitella parasitica TaxID=35722 RepID=A0A0B7NSR8_9FUNG|nr:hypothetical protein [Parasitella parasitica]
MNTASPITGTATPTSFSPIVDVAATVDDVELLNILGLTSTAQNFNAISCNDIAVLDWDDMPELSAEEDDEEEEDDDKESISSKNNKRKYNDQDENIFADLDFVEVPFTTTTKKQKTFVDEDDEFEDLLQPLDDDMRLALDLISSA